MSRDFLTRRQALGCYGWLLSTSPLLRSQRITGEPAGRIAPVDELVNTLEVEAMAQRKLPVTLYEEIAGSDRRAFDRITFRPRMMVNTLDLDLTLELFGDTMFTPMLVGPTSQQGRFHPEGELAMARGAAAAKTTMVVAGRSSNSIGQIAAQAKTALWYQVRPEADLNAVRNKVQEAVKCGCKAVCITLDENADWNAIDRLRRGISVPFVLKGILSVEAARKAVDRGVQGIVVSSYRARLANGPSASSIEVLPGIAEAVSGKIPILIDGSFRRGGDVLKAIALGARAILLGRPPLWGLAAYGAAGVQHVLELMQGELARAMVMCGKVKLAQVDRSVVRIHRR